jgi:hypothetical protein
MKHTPRGSGQTRRARIARSLQWVGAAKRGLKLQPMEHRSQRGSAVVKVGLTQFACVESPEINRAKQMDLIERAAGQGAQVVCTQELFTSQYFCQGEDHRFFRLCGDNPGSFSTEAMQALAKKHGIVIVGSLFERRAQRPLPQHRGGDRRGRIADGRLPQDAHPRRPALLREVLLHAGRPGFRVTTRSSARSACWSAGTSGSPRAHG